MLIRSFHSRRQGLKREPSDHVGAWNFRNRTEKKWRSWDIKNFQRQVFGIGPAASSRSFSGQCRAKFSKNFKSFQTRPADYPGLLRLWGSAGRQPAVATSDVIRIRARKRVKGLAISACDE
jgi:hypothetical protein